MTLSDRVSALKGPDRSIDAEIAAQLCGGSVDVAGRYWKPGVRGFCIAPYFTKSIDAAMSLVPEGMEELEIATIYGVARVGINLNHGPDDGPYYGESLSGDIALAICHAALKARGL